MAEHLNKLWTELVEGDTEWVVRKVGSVEMQNAGLVPSDRCIPVKDAVEAFLRYTDKPMIASPAAVVQGLVQACADKLIGIGRGTSVNNLHRKCCGQQIDIDHTETGIWIIPPFDAEAKTEPRSDETYPEPQHLEGHIAETPETRAQRPQGKTPDAATADPPAKRVARITIKGNIPMESWTDIFGSFINPSTRMNLKRRRLGIDFEFETHVDGELNENDPVLKTMQESARQLGLEIEPK